MKTISMEKLKVLLRESGVRVKPSYDFGHSITVSSALKDEQKKWLARVSKEKGAFKSGIINDLVLRFKPVVKDVRFNLKYQEAQSTAGFMDKRVGKVFGTRKNIKFTAFQLEKVHYNKLNELASYYNISRSAVIRFLIDQEMSK